MSLFEHFFKVLSLYLEARIRIRIHIKVTSNIRIRIKVTINVMRIRNSGLKMIPVRYVFCKTSKIFLLLSFIPAIGYTHLKTYRTYVIMFEIRMQIQHNAQKHQGDLTYIYN
jgi:hypothetical protein